MLLSRKRLILVYNSNQQEQNCVVQLEKCEVKALRFQGLHTSHLAAWLCSDLLAKIDPSHSDTHKRLRTLVLLDLSASLSVARRLCVDIRCVAETYRLLAVRSTVD